MVIIFEGFESVGKTEISTALAEELRIPRYKCPSEKGAFNGTYSPEMSLVYETRKFIEFLEQGIIDRVILDRDYPSEYAYGPIFRAEEYERLEIDRYLWEYDKRLYPQDTFIIFCIKEKYDEFYDEVVDISYQESVVARYRKFIEKTVNPVLILNTENENLEEQVKTIKDFIFKTHKLRNFNEGMIQVASKLPENAFSSVRFPGVFYGDEILFVGQNPGQPYEHDTESINLHKNWARILCDVENCLKYSDFELAHNQSYFKSKLYRFLQTFAKKDFGLLNKQWSFTNIVKYSTINNETPIVDNEADGKILKIQIDYLKPKRIISLGKAAHESLNNLEIAHECYYHPSMSNYSKMELAPW